MSMTRGQLKANVATMVERPDDTDFLTFLDSRIDQMIFALYDSHDWNWKHGNGSFYTVSGQESYDLSSNQRIYIGAVAGGPFLAGEVIHNVGSTATGVIITVGVGYLSFTSLTGTFVLGDVITGSTSGAAATSTTAASGGIVTGTCPRSSEDIELLWDVTNKKRICKVDVHTIREQYPQGSLPGKPVRYGAWGLNTIVFDRIPDGIYEIKYMYLTKAVLPTSDSDDLYDVCGIPDYCHYLLEKMVLAEAMIVHNDNRRDNLLLEIERLWRKRAIDADMKHLDQTARFKFWEEETQPYGTSFDDFLRYTWWNE